MPQLWESLMQAQMLPQQMPSQQSYQGLMGQQQNPYAVPVPIPVPPGQQQMQVIPPWARDQMDRQAVTQGYDRNAVQGDDVMRQFYQRHLDQEDI